MKKLHHTGLLVDHFCASIVSEITDDTTRRRFAHPNTFLPALDEIIVDSDGEKWRYQRVDVPSKNEVFFWSGWDQRCYLLMAGEKPMMDMIFYNQIFIKV